MTTTMRTDQYGGVKAGAYEATGFFRLEEEDGRHFFVTPEGNPYFMLGMNTVTPWFWNYLNNGFENVYGGDSLLWGKVALERVKKWGFNCLTYKTSELLIRQMEAGKVPIMPYAPVLKFIENNALERDDFPDPWTYSFMDHMDSVAYNLEALQHSPWLVGYFITNEMDCEVKIGWRNRWLRTLLQLNEAPSANVFRGILRSQYNNIFEFNEKYNTGYSYWGAVEPWVVGKAFRDGMEEAEKDMQLFNAALARQFYKLAHESISRYDPNHLILGSRFATDAEKHVLIGTKNFTDVVSLNRYFQIGTFDYLFEGLNKMHRHTGLPVLHSEFAWLIEGRDGAYPPAPSQKARGEAYAEWLNHALEIKELIGTCWYGYVDGGWVTEPGGEVMNFGLVDIHDKPYTPAVVKIQKANREAVRRFAMLFRRVKSTETPHVM